MKQERANAVGQMALVWLAGQPELLEAFLAESGLAPEDIRASAGEPAFLGFVLDAVLASDERVLAFAAEANLTPEEITRARARLDGGTPHWT